MAPSLSADTQVGPGEAEVLLDIAEDAIVDGLHDRPPAAPPVSALPRSLQEPRGIFVTLTVGGKLNGCIGTITGTEPLGHGVARHAWSAAFADPRLPSLRRDDYERLRIELSLLSPLSPVSAASRVDLLATLRPGLEGLVIAAGARQAVFLPSVWEQLPDPDDFLDHLQAKAGMPPRWWPPGMRGYRFTAQKFARAAGARGDRSRVA
jgi:AmmeMemoRadiSam system protein A